MTKSGVLGFWMAAQAVLTEESFKMMSWASQHELAMLFATWNAPAIVTLPSSGKTAVMARRADSARTDAEQEERGKEA